MRIRLPAFAAIALTAPVCWGFGADMTAGLNVAVDRIPEPIEVDGVAMTALRVTGRDVSLLALRLEASWRAQGSQVKVIQHGGWTLLSRLSGPRSEVIQWRMSSGTSELLWSSADITRSASPVPDAGISLPTGCVWNRSISGRDRQRQYLQRSARCTQSRHVLSQQLQSSLPKTGWRIVNAADGSLLVERLGTQGLISLTAEDDLGAWLTWLRVGP